MDYEYDWQDIYISSSPVNASLLYDQISSVIIEQTEGWRIPDSYFNKQFDPVQLLHLGRGHLLSAPDPIIQHILPLLSKTNINFTSLKANKANWPMEALIADRNFVIATTFQIQK